MAITLDGTYPNSYTRIGEATNEQGEVCGKYHVTYIKDDGVYHWGYVPGNVAHDYVGREETMVKALLAVTMIAATEDRKWRAWVEQSEQYAREAHGE